MKFDFEVQHRPGLKRTVADALSQLLTNQTKDSNFDDDLPAYAVADSHDEPNKRDKNEQTSLTIERILAAQREDSHCRHLVERADAPNTYVKIGPSCQKRRQCPTS